MTDTSSADRLAALERRRDASREGNRRRPAQASRVLAAGAGTAAVLTMVTAMAQADQVVEIVEAPILQTRSLASAPVVASSLPQSTASQPTPTHQSEIQTITITRPARTQLSNARTSASR